jgi:hypothetical protein
MPRPSDLPANSPLMPWPRLRRFLHLEGNLGGLRYKARVGIFELTAPDPSTVANEVVAVPESKQLVDSSSAERSLRSEPDV